MIRALGHFPAVRCRNYCNHTALTSGNSAGQIVNRYYDPATDQFLSVDPQVAQTGQPYAFVGDDPLNATDPLGLSGSAGLVAEAAWNKMVYQKCHGHPHRNGCRGINVLHDVVSGLDKVRHLGHVVAHGVNVGASKLQTFGENHISLSAEVCFFSCVGIEIQKGQFQGIGGSGGYLFGAGASLNVTSGPPDPGGESSHEIGLLPASASYGSGGSWSFGYGPGYVGGFGSQSISPEFG